MPVKRPNTSARGRGRPSEQGEPPRAAVELHKGQTRREGTVPEGRSRVSSRLGTGDGEAARPLVSDEVVTALFEVIIQKEDPKSAVASALLNKSHEERLETKALFRKSYGLDLGVELRKAMGSNWDVPIEALLDDNQPGQAEKKAPKNTQTPRGKLPVGYNKQAQSMKGKQAGPQQAVAEQFQKKKPVEIQQDLKQPREKQKQQNRNQRMNKQITSEKKEREEKEQEKIERQQKLQELKERQKSLIASLQAKKAKKPQGQGQKLQMVQQPDVEKEDDIQDQESSESQEFEDGKELQGESKKKTEMTMAGEAGEEQEQTNREDKPKMETPEEAAEARDRRDVLAILQRRLRRPRRWTRQQEEDDLVRAILQSDDEAEDIVLDGGVPADGQVRSNPALSPETQEMLSLCAQLEARVQELYLRCNNNAESEAQASSAAGSSTEHQGQAAGRRAPDVDAYKDDCKNLRMALQCADIRLICSLLCDKTSDQRQELWEAYTKFFTRDLEDDFKRLPNHYHQILKVLMMTSPRYDARCLRLALSKPKNDEEMLIAVLAILTDKEVADAKAEFITVYKKDVYTHAVEAGMTEIAALLMQREINPADSEAQADTEEAKQDAKLIQADGEKFKTKDSMVRKLIATKSKMHLKAVAEVYQKLVQESVEDAILREMGDHGTGRLLAMVWRALVDPTTFFAKWLQQLQWPTVDVRAPGQGPAARERLNLMKDRLTRIFITRFKVDLGAISEKYGDLTGESLRQTIKKSALGPFKKVLLALLSSQ